jgi:hypothetical protein
VGFVVILATIPLWIVLSLTLGDKFGLSEGQQRLLLGAIAAPSIVGLSFIVWKWGTYRSTGPRT